MAKILPLGCALKTDENGFIISDSDINKIISPWKEAVEDFKSFHISKLGSTIHSLYIRGSVPRGLAIKGKSDLDTIVVVLDKLQNLNLTWLTEENEKFEKRYSFLTALDIQFISYHELFTDSNNFHKKFTIKTQSACIYGHNLAEEIAPFKANIITAQQLCINMHNAIENVNNALCSNLPKKYIREWCRWIMKVFVRNGLHLVMDKEGLYTRDLYPSYKFFSIHYPLQEHKMKQALELAINPSEDPILIINFINNFGLWLIKELEKKFQSDDTALK